MTIEIVEQDFRVTREVADCAPLSAILLRRLLLDTGERTDDGVGKDAE